MQLLDLSEKGIETLSLGTLLRNQSSDNNEGTTENRSASANQSQSYNQPQQGGIPNGIGEILDLRG